MDRSTWPDWAKALVRSDAEQREVMDLGRRRLIQRYGITDRKAQTLRRLIQGVAHEPEATAVAAPDVRPDGPTFDFNEQERVYVFSLPRRAHPLRVHANDVESMLHDYSNIDGAPATINQLCGTYALSRYEVRSILAAFGKTHDSDPFTPQQWDELSDDELRERLLIARKQAVTSSAMHQLWSETRRKAAMWDRFAETMIARFTRVVEGLNRVAEPAVVAPRVVPRPPAQKAPEQPQGLLVVSPTDLHYGKLGWEGFGPGAYNRETCRKRLMDAIAKMRSRLPVAPERLLVPIGSDWFHIDNALGTTTRGTPQDMDGVPQQIFEEGIQLQLDMLDALRDIAPNMDIILQAGNHDNMLSQAGFLVAKAYFRNDPRVRFLGNAGPYQTYEYGFNLIGITHGDGLAKAKDLGPLLAHHHGQAWGRSKEGQRYFLTGNLHHHTVQEGAGVTVILCPSLSGADRWHVNKGFTTSRAQMAAMFFDPDDGLVNTILTPVR